jgi:hypothetical protein
MVADCYHPDRAILACAIGVLDAADSRERGAYTFTTSDPGDLAAIAGVLDAEHTPYDLGLEPSHTARVDVECVLRVTDEGRTVTLRTRLAS